MDLGLDCELYLRICCRILYRRSRLSGRTGWRARVRLDGSRMPRGIGHDRNQGAKANPLAQRPVMAMSRVESMSECDLEGFRRMVPRTDELGDVFRRSRSIYIDITGHKVRSDDMGSDYKLTSI